MVFRYRMGLLKVRRLSYFFPEPRGQIHHQQRCKLCSLGAGTVCFAITTPTPYMFSSRLIDQHIHMVRFLPAHARPVGLRFPPPTFPFPTQPPKTGHRVSPLWEGMSFLYLKERDKVTQDPTRLTRLQGGFRNPALQRINLLLTPSPRMKVWLRLTLPKRTTNTVTQH